MKIMQAKCDDVINFLSTLIECKVCRCYLLTFLTQIPIFGWCVVRCGSKNKHHKDTCCKESDCILQLYELLYTQ